MCLFSTQYHEIGRASSVWSTLAACMIVDVVGIAQSSLRRGHDVCRGNRLTRENFDCSHCYYQSTRRIASLAATLEQRTMGNGTEGVPGCETLGPG